MGVSGKGRPAKPTALKVVHGTRSDRVNKQEPLPAMGEVEAPGWLSPLALSYWDRYAPDLKAKGVLTPWDVHAFAEWCDAAATVEQATLELTEQGHLVEQDVFDRNGKPTGTRVVTNPWEFIKRNALSVTKERAARFGLTPSERSGVAVGADGGKPDEAAAFLRR